MSGKKSKNNPEVRGKNPNIDCPDCKKPKKPVLYVNSKGSKRMILACECSRFEKDGTLIPFDC